MYLCDMKRNLKRTSNLIKYAVSFGDGIYENCSIHKLTNRNNP